ncbi:actin family [Zopfochytrium polystomum]|nr:actin family [Zopfochytrium polystomum]
MVYKRPFERGYLTDWETQRQVLDRLFSQDVLNVDPSGTDLILTQPPFNFPLLARQYDEVVFEEYGFQSCLRATGAELCAWHSEFVSPRQDCLLVIDSGFSFTHVIPLLRGRPIEGAIRRINVGGKLLTNHLKEIVSYRHFNMMDKTAIVNDMKEQCCFVSRDFDVDMKLARKGATAVEYVLPDFQRVMKGFVRTQDTMLTDTDQTITLNRERFMVPELVFHPSDIGIDQAGLAEAVFESVSCCHQELQGPLFANILIVGGNACLPGFPHRLYSELRPLVSMDLVLQIHTPANPVRHVWQCGAMWGASCPDQFKAQAMSRAWYMEHGQDRFQL